MTTITVSAEIQLPRLPNYLLLVGAGEATKIDIADVATESLREVGKAWTEALVDLARERRDNRKPEPLDPSRGS